MNKGKLGYTLSAIGGLMVILNFTVWQDHLWKLTLSIIAAAMALAGLLMISSSKQDDQTKKE